MRSPIFPAALLLVSVTFLPVRADLFVSNQISGNVAEFDNSGAYVTTFADSLNAPQGLAFNGNHLLVAQGGGDEISSFNATTGASEGALVSGVATPLGIGIGPDGDLYVASVGNNTIERYNASTGAFIDTFVTASSGGLSSPGSVAWGADNNLYVSSSGSNEILQYNGTTGAFISAFVSANLSTPLGLNFIAGNLYVADFGSNLVKVFNSSGTFLTAISTSAPQDVLLGPGGLAYISNSNFISSYNPTTGDPPIFFVNPGDHLTTPSFMAFSSVPEPSTCALLLGAFATVCACFRRRLRA